MADNKRRNLKGMVIRFIKNLDSKKNMRTCRNGDFLQLFLVVAMMGTILSGLAHASDWMDARLGLAPLKFDPSGHIQQRYLQTLSNAPDM
jgi:hypothetical protein